MVILLWFIALLSPSYGDDLSTLRQFWQSTYPDLRRPALTSPNYTIELLAKAKPDECFAGIGASYPEGPPCRHGRPKTNEAYIWGMTMAPQAIWFGTMANTTCGAGHSPDSGFSATPILGNPILTSAYVCERDAGVYATPSPSISKDWRPPNIYRYDLSKNTLERRTPNDPLIQQTAGFRSAVYFDGIVLLTGAGLAGTAAEGKINVFAFDANSLAFLGAATLEGIKNLRRWVVTPAGVYAGVQTTDNAGAVIRWRGDRNHLFRFEIVGRFDSEVSEVALHEGRIFASTWPILPGFVNRSVGATLAIFMGPPLGEQGLSTHDSQAWTKVWSVSEYEADPSIALTYGGGAMASYGGYLYWGTLNIPFTGASAIQLTYDLTLPQMLPALIGGLRPAAIFRGRHFATTPEIQTLYGLSAMPIYDHGHWRIAPSPMGRPQYGTAGFGNPFNAYIWSMAVYRNELFVGTMDVRYNTRLSIQALPRRLLGLIAGIWGPSERLHPLQLPLGHVRGYGADLYRFPAASRAALPVSRDGLGNLSNFGIRNLIADERGLYAGTANPFNLLYKPLQPDQSGGWELLRIYRK
jgi:hypothetical protein